MLSPEERIASRWLFAHVDACAICHPIGDRIQALQRPWGAEEPSAAAYERFQELIGQLCPVGLSLHNGIVNHGVKRILGEQA